MRLLDEKDVINVIKKFIGYLDDDMIERIKIAIKKDVPTAASEVTAFKSDRVTKETIDRFGVIVEQRVKDDVLRSLAYQLNEKGAVTWERVEDLSRMETVYIGRVLAVKKEVNHDSD